MGRVTNALGLAKPGRRMVVQAPAGEVMAVALSLLYRRQFRDSELNIIPFLDASEDQTIVRVLSYGTAKRGFFYGLAVESFLPFLAFSARSVRNARPGQAVVVCERHSTHETVLTLSLIELSSGAAVNAEAIFCDVIEEIVAHFRAQGRLIDAGVNVDPQRLDPTSPANFSRFLTLRKLARQQGQTG